ncbi:MAG: M20 family metallopeptidase [Nitrososphaerales archaeon]
MQNDILARIRSEDIVRLTQELVRIPSPNPPGLEAEVSDFLASKMKAIGFKVQSHEVSPGRPNVVGHMTFGSGGKGLMFNGHLDVVPPGDRSLWDDDPYSGILKEGRVYGRGTSDMKGGIASIMVAAKALADSSSDLQGDLIFSGVVDEESSGSGSKRIVEDGYKADMVVIGEPTDRKICIAHKGNMWLEITTQGIAEHSSQVRVGKSANAVYRMTKIVSLIEEMLPDLQEIQDDLVGNPTITVGLIEGGTKPNIVPDACRIVVDRRLLPAEDPKRVLEDLKARILASIMPEFDAAFKILIAREGAQISIDEEIVKIASKSIKEALKISPEIGGLGATTDMSFFVRAGIPTIIYGPGSIKQAHVANEFIDVHELTSAAKVYATIAANALHKA